MTQHPTEPISDALDSTSQPGGPTRADLALGLLLVACLLGMFWKVVFTPAMFYYRDVYNYTFPSARLIHDLCRQGFLPYWNPYLNYGQPVLANPNLLFFYPFTLLIVLLPINLGFTLHFVVHFALAGIGVYALARRWGQSYLAAFFAALVFMLSGPVLSLGNIYNLVACAAWIPWALLATDHALTCRRLRAWVVVTVVFALQWLAGEPLTMMGTFALCFAYALHYRGVASELWSKPNRRVAAIFAVVGVAMVLLCAAQLLTASTVLSQSRRGAQGLSFREATTWSLNPLILPELMVQDFYGAGIGADAGWSWLLADSTFGPHYVSLFIGFVPLLCALAGWALARNRRRNFVASAGAASLLLAFGHFTPVYALAYLLFPPLTVVRYPEKLLVTATFLCAVLAGWGFDALRAPDIPWKAHARRVLIPLKVLFACAVAALVAAWILPGPVMAVTRWGLRQLGAAPSAQHALADFLVTILRYQMPGLIGFCLAGIVLVLSLAQGKRWARPGLYVFALIAVVQLMIANFSANPTVPKSFFSYRPPVLNEFKDAPGTYRVASFWPTVLTPDSADLQSFVNFDSIPEAAEFGAEAQGALQMRLQLATGAMLNEVEGNINLDLERSLPPYLYDMEIYQDRHASDHDAVDCLLGRTNVKYIIRPPEAASAGSPPSMPSNMPMPMNMPMGMVMSSRLLGDVFNGSATPSHLFESACFLPRAYVAGNALFSTNSEETLGLLAWPDFDAAGTVILAARPDDSPAVTSADAVGQVEMVHRDPNTVTLHASLERAGYVVLLDRYDPDWEATIDGHPAPVLRANQAFRAVYAKAGNHEIRFRYHQRGLRAGVVISLLTLAALIALCAFSGHETQGRSWRP